jgi:large subunit ribosomal protein L3
MKKIGMSAIKIDNQIVGATMLWATQLVAIGKKILDRDGYEATIMAYGQKKIKSWHKPQHSMFKSLGYAPEVICETREFIVEPNEQHMNLASMFQIGDKIDLRGKTIGRGFAGPMKRHNFAGLPATHGVSRAHRAHGSTGSRTSPGRVFKGKKMAGHYGNENVTIQSMKIVFLQDMELAGQKGTVIGVKGAVPGSNGSICFIKRAVKAKVGHQ